MMGLMVRLAIAGLSAIPLATSPMVAAASTAPPVLSLEFLSGAPQIAATCNPGGTSTITYFVTGVANGPYPGTFAEVGRFTIGPENAPRFINGFQSGPVTSFDAVFAINSPVGKVTGVKTLVIPSTVVGTCYDFSAFVLPGGFPTISGTFREMCACPFGLAYQARITAPDGSQFADSGQSGVLINQLNATVVAGPGSITPSNAFNEAFQSSGLTTIQVCPAEGSPGDDDPPCMDD
jgi:hypothetical protein